MLPRRILRPSRYSPVPHSNPVKGLLHRTAMQALALIRVLIVQVKDMRAVVVPFYAALVRAVFSAVERLAAQDPKHGDRSPPRPPPTTAITATISQRTITASTALSKISLHLHYSSQLAKYMPSMLNAGT